MAYTPGPWEFNQSPLGAYAISAKVGPLMVCPAIAHGLEDARLIAAAPDLLAALKGLLAEIDSFEFDGTATSACDASRAAIAKAEGKV